MTKHVLPERPIPEALYWRLLRHSNGVGLATLPIVLSLVVLVSAFLPSFEPSMSLARIPDVLNVALASIIGTGGVVALCGLLWNGKVVSTGWTLERSGWLLVAGGWDGYAAAVLYYFPEQVIAWVIPAYLGALALVRAIVVYIIERILRPRAENAKASREANESWG